MIYLDFRNWEFIKEFCLGFEHVPFIDVNKYSEDGYTLQEFVGLSMHCFILNGHVFNFEDDKKFWADAKERAMNLNEFAKENSFDDWFDGYFKTSYIVGDDLYVLHPFAATFGQICITENNDLFKLVENRPDLLDNSEEHNVI